MITFIFITLIAGYSGWNLYKALRNKAEGKCDSCPGCSMNGSCPVQSLKRDEQQSLVNVSLVYKNGK